MTHWQRKSWLGLLVASLLLFSSGIAQASVFNVNVVSTDDVVTGEVMINNRIAFRVHVLKGDSVPVFALSDSRGVCIRPDIADGMFMLKFNR